jgi:uncharacterized protein YbaP (TraB family)
VRFRAILLLPALSLFFCSAVGAASVWKITGPNGGTLYLGGSMHALRPTDYPLPGAYNRAFDASSRLVFEEDPKAASRHFRDLIKAGQYRGKDNLKNHVNPRTYEYLRTFFAIYGVPEQEFVHFRPWFIDILITLPPPEYYQLGVEEFLLKRAQANGKPMSGLESPQEHNGVYVGLSDREGEALLLISFINAVHSDVGGVNLAELWRRGDVDTLARLTREAYHDFPSFGERLLSTRNRNWLPKIENFLRSGQTYFVVVGAAHLGGADGLLSMLRARGYRTEQL